MHKTVCWLNLIQRKWRYNSGSVSWDYVRDMHIILSDSEGGIVLQYE